jgi:hypothetical protein
MGRGGTALDGRRNGHGTAADEAGTALVAESRRPAGPSTKPALIVFGLAFAIFIVGVALELASGDQSRPSASPASVTTARGAGLHAVPARPLLKTIVTAGQPPDDLLDALAVPRGSTADPSSAINQGVESYDRSLRFEAGTTEQRLITFFRAQLPSEHWKVLSQGPSSTAPGYQILAQHPASDGLEWELGVTVAPTAFGSPSGTSTTAFTFRLFSQSDQD